MTRKHFDRREPTLDGSLPQDGRTNPFVPPSAPVTRKAGRGKLLPYQKAGRVIRLMGWLGVVGTVGVGAAVLIPSLSAGGHIPIEFAIVLGLLLATTASLFIIGAAVMRRATWGRYAGIVYGIISLPGVPIGTLVGGYLLWQLTIGWNEVEA